MSELYLYVIAAFSAFSFVLYWTLAIWSNHQINRVQHTVFVQRRSLAIIRGVSLAMLASITGNMVIVAGWATTNNQLSMNGYALNLVGWFALIFFRNARSWLLFFNQKWTWHVMQRKWQSMITDDTGHTNFWLNRKSTLGNTNFVIKSLGLVHAFGFAIAMCAMVIDISSPSLPSNVRVLCKIVSMVVFCLFFAFYATINCRIKRLPRQDDVLDLMWENRMNSRLLMCLLAVLVGWAALTNYMRNNAAAAVLVAPVEMLLAYLFIYITVSPAVKVRHGDIYHQQQMTAGPQEGLITLDAVLANAEAVHVFMCFLSKEQSMESLLSLIELDHFERAVLAGNTTIAKDDLCIEQLCSVDLPTALVMQGRLDGDTWRDAALYLHEKYIAAGSELEINIGWEPRSSCAKMMLDLEAASVVDVLRSFEELKLEMYCLLEWPLVLFRQHEGYGQLKDALANVSVAGVTTATVV